VQNHDRRSSFFFGIMKKTLVLGLGNPILTDDGIGIRVVRALAAHPLPPDVVLEETSLGGLRLLEIILGYGRIILVDAIQTDDGRPGEIHRLATGSLLTSRHSGSTHDLSLFGALQLGRELGMDIPDDSNIMIIAVQVEDVQTLGEAITPEVEASIPGAVELILTLLREQERSL
jgi:hydrogenase maturation protease